MYEKFIVYTRNVYKEYEAKRINFFWKLKTPGKTHPNPFLPNSALRALAGLYF